MAQENQEYIQQKVNPILENLVTQLLLERPEHLAPFMIKWLSEHAKTPAAAALTEGVNELNELKLELEGLQSEVKKLEDATSTTKPPSGGSKPAPADDEDEEEEDDDEDAPDLPPPAAYLNKARASVSAEAYGAWNVKAAWTPPVYPKTEEQKTRIRSVLQTSFMFANLEAKDMSIVIDAMQEKVIETKSRVIQQGDDGDHLFVVEEGELQCFKKIDSEEKLVKTCKTGDAFGELALLYNCPRAASVDTTGRCVLWQLDRESFGNVVRDAAQKKREQYEKFLKVVPVLSTLDTYERQLMCDALHTESFAKGAEIVRQGEPGDKFYILEDGECYVEKVYAPGTPKQEVMQYKSGDYFGELSLLSNEPRAATVVAKSDCKLLALKRRTFIDLLGSLDDILKRNAATNYK